MDLLELPLDALLLRLCSIPAAATTSSFWTSVAFLTAVLGLWAIRAVGFKSGASSSSSTSLSGLSPPPADLRVTEEAKPHPASLDRKNAEPNVAVPSPASSHVEEEAGSTPKARFTAYFPPAADCSDDGADAQAEELTEPDDGITARGNFDYRVCGRSKIMAAQLKVDLGWYRYQELTALNGSVVRLWDGRGSGRRRYSS